MKRRVYYLSLGLMVLAMAGCMKNDEQLNVQPTASVQDVASNLKSASLSTKYIVVLKDDDATAQVSDVNTRNSAVKLRGHGLLNKHAFRDQITEVYETAVQGFTTNLTADQAKEMSADSNVKLVETDQIVALSKDMGKTKKSGGAPSTQVVPWGIARVGGGGNYNGDNVAWIIDSGIDLNHPDLNVGAKKGVSFVPGVDSPDDDNAHGTFIAGIIGAIDNKIGVVGVAPGAKVIPVKVIDATGNTTLSEIISGINYVAEKAHSGDVATLCLSLNTTSDILDNAILAASSNKGKFIDFVIAAGNEGIDATLRSPARVKGPHIYTVSAMAIGDLWASFSNWGKPVDYCAPGVDIASTYPGGLYATGGAGTSFSAPHVAGLLLLGKIKSGGTVIGDPDGHPDIIAVHK